MTKVCVFLDPPVMLATVDAILYTISMRVPCWVTFDINTLEVCIECRQEDTPFVERELAALV